MGVRNDFVVESNGRCFVCLKQNSSCVTPSNMTNVLKHQLIYSLQSLSEFLEINMKSVFKWAEHIPLDLLKRVEQSKLKVELCRDCGSLIEDFTKLYLQLEKIQMGLMCSLEVIREKLQTPDDAEITVQLSTSTDAKSGSGISEKLDILKALRTEAIDKCSTRLNSISPRVRICSMTRKKLNREKYKLRILRNQTIIKIENVKAETQLTNPVSDDVSEQDSYLDNEDNDSVDSFTEDSLVTKEESHSANVQTRGHLTGEHDHDQLKSPVDPIQHDGGTTGKRKRTNVVTKCFVEVAPSGLKGMEIPKSIFNNKTGKHNCPRCHRQFSETNNYHVHYKTIHIGFRYQCSQCPRKFPQKSHCYRHYQIEHKGVRFLCHVCARQFGRKHNLTNHLKGSCSRGIPPQPKKDATCHCPICEIGFTQKGLMERHLRNIHHQRV